MEAVTRRRELRYTETITNAIPVGREDEPPGPSSGCPWDEPGCGDAEPFPDKPVGELTSKELGALGEELAARHLLESGYDVLERNYRCPEGEADIVAFDPDDDCVVLAEVKTRRDAGLRDGAYAEEAVDRAKRRRYRRIASCYLMDNFPVPSIRFDVLAVSVSDDRTYELHHAVGAYDWDAER